MNRTFDSLRLSNSPRLTDGVQAMSGAPRSFTPEQALFRLDLMRSLRMHRRLAFGFFLVGVVLAVLYVARYWSVYTAECLVFVQPTPSGVLEAAPMHWPYNYDPATYDSYIQQQMSSMTRPDVLAGAVKKLGPGVWQESDESEQSAADRLKGAIEVARVGTSYQVAITAHARNADTAAALANAVAASYIENTSHEQRASDAERLAMLKEERDRIKKELDDDRTEQATLNAQLGVAAIGPVAPEHYDDDIAKIHEDLVKARTDHDEAAARLTSMNSSNGLSSAALDAEADQLISTDPGLSSLKQALLTRRAALVSQMANLTPSHPQYKQDAEELQKIDASLESSTQELRAKAASRIEEQLRTDLDRTSGLEARLNGELAQMTRAAAGATPKLQRSSDLSNDITRLQTRFNAVDEQLQNQTLEDNAPGTAHVAEAAVPPAHPSVGGVIRNAFILLFGFIGLGLVAAVAAHKMDRRVYAASDIEQLLGYGPMAQLPNFDEVSDEVAEAHLLRMASGIEHACKNGQLSSCVFTGTGPGVGVTTVVKRVRDMLGVLGAEAVLVDATGPVPQERRSGLSGETAAAGTDLKRSSLSTALTPHASEAVTSGREVLLLTDTAPLTVSAEAEYLARRADCTILVIESGATTRAQLRAAAESLQRLDAAAVGFVLNRVSLANADESFRHSVGEVERHLRVQGRTSGRTVAQNSRVVPEAALVDSLRRPLRETPALAEKPVTRAALSSPAAHPARPATQERPAPPARPATAEQVAAAPGPLPKPAPFVVAEERAAQPLPQAAPESLRQIEPVSHWSAKTASQPQQEPAEPHNPERVAAAPAPLPKPAQSVVAEEREEQAFARAASGYSTAPPARPARLKRVAVSVAPLQWTTPFVGAEEREAQPLPKPTPAASAAQPQIKPVSFSLAKNVAKPLHEPVVLPIPERMPVITGEHDVPPKLEPVPIVPYEVERAAEPAQKPASAIASKPVAEEQKQEPVTQWAPETRQEPQAVVTQLAQQPSEEAPWWLTEAPAHAETAMIHPRTPRVGTWHSMAANGEQKTAAPDVEEKAVSEAPTRLSGLRGLLFPLGNRDSGSKKNAERHDNGNGKVAANGHAKQAETPDPDQTIVLEAVKPQPFQEPVHSKAEGAVARGALPRWVTAEPEFLPPREESSDNGKALRATKPSYEEDDFNDIQILPARRGQYRR